MSVKLPTVPVLLIALAAGDGGTVGCPCCPAMVQYLWYHTCVGPGCESRLREAASCCQSQIDQFDIDSGGQGGCNVMAPPCVVREERSDLPNSTPSAVPSSTTPRAVPSAAHSIACGCVPQCGVPFFVSGKCDLEGILFCNGKNGLPPGSEVCVECFAPSTRRRDLKGKRIGKSTMSKSTKDTSGSSSSSVLPETKEFTIKFLIAGDSSCDSFGTYDALWGLPRVAQHLMITLTPLRRVSLNWPPTLSVDLVVVREAVVSWKKRSTSPRSVFFARA